MNNNLSIRNYFLSMFIALTALLGIQMEVLYGFQFKFVEWQTFLWTAVIFLVISWIIYVLEFKKRYLGILGIVCLVAGLLFERVFYVGAMTLLRKIFDFVNDYYLDVSFPEIEGYSYEYLSNYNKMLVVLGTFLILYGLVLFAINIKNIHFFSSICLALPVVLGFIGAGVDVNCGALCFLSCSGLLLVIGQGITTRDPGIRSKIHGQAAVWGGIFILGSLVLVGSVYSPSDYKSIQALNKIKRGINDFLNQHELPAAEGKPIHKENELGVNGLSHTGQSSKLGTLDKVELTNHIDLEVSIDADSEGRLPDRLYVRGFIGKDYEANTWTGTQPVFVSENPDFVEGEDSVYDYSNTLISNQGKVLEGLSANENLDAYGFYVEVIPKIQTDFYYLPYYTNKLYLGDCENRDGEFVSNAYVSSATDVMNYGTQGQIGEIADVLDYSLEDLSCLDEQVDYVDYTSRSYEELVKELYLDLPSPEEVPEFYEHFSSMEYVYQGHVYEMANRGYDPSIGIRPYVYYIYDYLAMYEYTLSPGATKEGTDYVEDFLFHKKQGYCTAYASAATLMFRQMGIPARYVEGYVLTKDMIESGRALNELGSLVHVKNRSSHAWVEIYLEKFGWVPIEVTVGDLTSGVGQEETQTKEAESKSQETTKEVQIASTKKKEKSTKKKEEGSKKVEETTTTLKVKTKAKTSKKNSIKGVIPWFFLGVGFVLFIICINLLIRFLDKKKIRKPDPDYIKKRLAKICQIRQCPIKQGQSLEEEGGMLAKAFHCEKEEAIKILSLIDYLRFSKNGKNNQKAKEELARMAEEFLFIKSKL